MKALKVTKGKPFSSGVVFINGKFIEPPYVVERYGNVLRINKIQITNPIVDWSEFLKTQAGLDVAKADAAAIAHESAPAAPAPEPEPEPEVKEPEPKADAMEISTDDDDDILDDLFDDAPAKPKKAAKPKPAAKKQVASKPQPKPKAEKKPDSTAAGSSGSAFVMTDRAKMLVGQINKLRTDIDASLRRGCFYCFGSGYSRVSGDQGAANRILKKLPDIMKAHSDYEPFYAALRKHGFVYFPPRLAKEIFNNRTDYLTIQTRWKKVQEEQKFDKMMQDAGVSY